MRPPLLLGTVARLPRWGQVALAARCAYRALPAMGTAGEFKYVASDPALVFRAIENAVLRALNLARDDAPFLPDWEARVLSIGCALGQNAPYDAWIDEDRGVGVVFNSGFQGRQASHAIATMALHLVDALHAMFAHRSPTEPAADAIVTSFHAIDSAVRAHAIGRDAKASGAESMALSDCEALVALRLEEPDYASVSIPASFIRRFLWSPNRESVAWQEVVTRWKAALRASGVTDAEQRYVRFVEGSGLEWLEVYKYCSEWFKQAAHSILSTAANSARGEKIPVKQPTVFISHSSADHIFVHRLAHDLKRNGFRVWVDEAEIKVGDRLRDKIEKGIEGSDFMVVVLSRASTHRGRRSSHWVNVELDAAFMEQTNTWRTSILPCRIEPCRVPTLLSGLRRAEFVGRPYEDAFEQLVEAMATGRA